MTAPGHVDDPASPSSSAAADQAFSFGRFVLHEKLGAGGTADVYRAEVVEGAEPIGPIVIKRMRSFSAFADSRVRMFASEARISRQLRHPGIARTYEIGDVDGEPYLVMERVDGIDLGRALRSCRAHGARMPPALACHLVGEVAAALAYAHALDDDGGRPLEIVHRDVSPSNIMIGHDGRVKLVDFGIAKAAAHIRDDRTRTGVIKGKLSYMSPEQVDGRPVDGRTDLFALGLVFHECLTLEQVLRGDNELATVQRIRRLEVPAPSQLAPGITRELDEIVLRMLARAPEERYATGNEVVAALAPLRAEMPADEVALACWLGTLEPMAAPEERVTEKYLPREPARTAPMAASGRWRRAWRAALTHQVASWRQLAAHAGVAAVIAMLSTMLALRVTEVPEAAAALQIAPERSVRTTATAVATPAARRVRLQVLGQNGAHALLDGADIGALPLDLDLPVAARPRSLTVVASDGQRWTQDIDGDGDAVVLIEALREQK